MADLRFSLMHEHHERHLCADGKVAMADVEGSFIMRVHHRLGTFGKNSQFIFFNSIS